MPGNPLVGDRTRMPRGSSAYGLRNPFRFTFRPGTNEIWVGDVGWDDWEEIDRVVSTRGGAVANFGWPCYEGVGRQASYESVGLQLCTSLYAAPAGSAARTTPTTTT